MGHLLQFIRECIWPPWLFLTWKQGNWQSLAKPLLIWADYCRSCCSWTSCCRNCWSRLCYPIWLKKAFLWNLKKQIISCVLYITFSLFPMRSDTYCFSTKGNIFYISLPLISFLLFSFYLHLHMSDDIFTMPLSVVKFVCTLFKFH